MGKFVYRGKERTADDISRRAKEGTRDYDSVYVSGLPIYKPKEGENCVRILPSTWEEPDWDMTIWSHYDVGPDGARYLCLAKMKGEPCPVCEARNEAVDDEEKDKLRQVKGALAWIIDRDDEKAGPQLWSLPFTKVRNEIHERSVDKKSRTPLLVDDPDEGYDIVFNRKGTDQRTQYTGVEVSRDASPLSDNPKTAQRWLAFVEDHPLPECLNYYEYDYIKKVLYGKAASKAVAEDEEEEVSTSSRRSRLRTEADEEEEAAAPRSRRRPALVEEEEEEAPSRPVRRARGVKEDQDEEPPFERGSKERRRALLDEGDDEGDEEEEAPLKPSRRSAPKEEDEEEGEELTPRSRRAAPVEEEEGEEEEVIAPAKAARAALGRLRPPGSRR